MVLVQKWQFFQTFFLGNIGQENVFYDLLQRKNCYLGYKNTKFKKSKYWHFSKPRVLVQKWPFFSTFFLRQYRQGKCLLRYSRTKNSFLGYKSKNLKKSKIDFFTKGLTHGFCPKITIISTCFFKAM